MDNCLTTQSEFCYNRYMETKTCTKCQETKTLDQFHKDHTKQMKDGIDYYCKYCRSGASIKSHKNNKKRCSVEGCDRVHYAKTYCRMHYGRMDRNGTLETKIKPRKDGIYYYKGKAVHTRDYQLMYKYKISLDEFKARSINGCELCGDNPERSLHVDHDHKCCDGLITCGNCVRGIVCSGCNKIIDKYETGLIRVDHPLLEKVAEYVRKYNG
jgi:hypothetical protein